MLSKDFVVKKNGGTGNVTQAPTENNLTNIPMMGVLNTQALTLVFAPKWLCKLSGKLHIQNITTNEQLIYHIKATCE